MKYLIYVVIIILTNITTCGADELYHYDVIGKNDDTGLTVTGRAWEQDKEGNFKVKLYDMSIVEDECTGAWIAYGTIQATCGDGQTYTVEVVE